MDSLPIIIAALVAVFIAWKVLKGVVKTLALVAILIVAAIFVFGVL
ncbi:hypothetical protein [Croceicoccus sediminis]|nr:hypothetical protein [Croceicoccus sediminis]